MYITTSKYLILYHKLASDFMSQVSIWPFNYILYRKARQNKQSNDIPAFPIGLNIAGADRELGKVWNKLEGTWDVVAGLGFITSTYFGPEIYNTNYTTNL
jgi:hypothetical protein